MYSPYRFVFPRLPPSFTHRLSHVVVAVHVYRPRRLLVPFVRRISPSLEKFSTKKGLRGIPLDILPFVFRFTTIAMNQLCFRKNPILFIFLFVIASVIILHPALSSGAASFILCSVCLLPTAILLHLPRLHRLQPVSFMPFYRPRFTIEYSKRTFL